MAYDFQQLKIWQTAVELLIGIYSLTATFPRTETYGLIEQVRRSANAIAANIAEASGRHFKKDKIRVLYQARGEIEETRSHLLIAAKLKLADQLQLMKLVDKYSMLARQLNAFVKSIQKP